MNIFSLEICTLFLLLASSIVSFSFNINDNGTKSQVQLIGSINPHHETRGHFESFRQSSQSEWDNYDPFRVEKINEILIGVHQNHSNGPQSFPKDVGKLIGTYDHNNFLKILYDKVINNLRMLTKRKKGKNKRIGKWKNPSFYNENFASDLALILSSRDLEFSYHHCFWFNLSTLLFKWMLYMRQKTANDNEEFNRISKNIESVARIINENSSLKIPFNFNSKAIGFPHSEFKNLIHSELYEIPQIFPLFASMIEYFYDQNGKGDHFHENGIQEKGKKDILNELKFKYFNGNYNTNILLKYLIVIHDPKGVMRECIMKDDSQISHLLALSLNENITRDYLENLRTKGPKDLEITNMRFLNNSAINFYLSNNRKFEIFSIESFIDLSRRLREENLLEMKIIKWIVRLKFNHGSLDWKLKRFKVYLDEHEEYHNFSKNEINECIEYLQLLSIQENII